MNNQIDKLLITGAGFNLDFSKVMPGTNELKNIEKFTNCPNNKLKLFSNKVIEYFDKEIKNKNLYNCIMSSKLGYCERKIKKINYDDFMDNLEIIFDYLYIKIRQRNSEAVKIHKMLSYLFFYILNEIPDDFSMKNLSHFLIKYDVLTTNWDIIFDYYLYHLKDLNYGINTYYYDDGSMLDNSTSKKFIKYHGSANWAYCKKCKKTFYTINEKLAQKIYCGLENKDISEALGNKYNYMDKCPVCNSYLNIVAKNFGKNKLNSPREIYSLLKQEAENLLKKHDKWVVVGHSFREDDKEFLNLLQKHCSSKNIDVINLKDNKVKEMSKQYLEKATVKYYNCGLGNYIEKNNNN